VYQKPLASPAKCVRRSPPARTPEGGSARQHLQGNSAESWRTKEITLTERTAGLVAPLRQPTAPYEDPSRAVSGVTRIATLVIVIVPFLGLLAAVVLLWGWGLSWVEMALLFGMYLLTGLGITVGYHRLFTHRSFETGRTVQFVLGVLGSMAVQGPL